MPSSLSAWRVAAAAAIKLPALFGIDVGSGRGLLCPQPEPLRAAPARRVLRLEAAARTRHGRLARAGVRRGRPVFSTPIPFTPGGHTEPLTALHLPIALWLVVGIAYAGGRWSQVGGRMDFIRFSGELFIYYVLIALGGGVLTAFMALIFQAIGIDVEPFFESWLLPCGAAGAVLIAAWLVEAKQSVIENMAPVLTRLFTPLFAAVLVAFLATLLWTGRGVDLDRERPDRLRPAAGAGPWPAALLRLGPGPAVASWRVRCRAGRAGGQRAAGRRGGAVGHRRTHQRVRLHAEPRGRPRRERHSPAQSGVVGRALHPVPTR